MHLELDLRDSAQLLREVYLAARAIVDVTVVNYLLSSNHESGQNALDALIRGEEIAPSLAINVKLPN